MDEVSIILPFYKLGLLSWVYNVVIPAKSGGVNLVLVGKPMTNLALLPEDIRSEFSIDEQGRAFASRRAIARLAGISECSIRNLVNNLGALKSPSKILEPFAGQDFEGALKLPDVLVSAIIQHYAFKGREQAQLTASAFSAIGFRSWLQSELGWQQPQHKLPKSYAEALLEAGRLALENERLEAEKALLEQENLQLSEAVDELFDYSSIVRIAKFNKVSERLFDWRKLKAASLKMGKEIKQVPDPRFETKNLYSHDVWRVCYPDYRLPETTTLVISR